MLHRKISKMKYPIENKYIESYCTGLKILGTFTGPCQFNSGPGHQLSLIKQRLIAANANTDEGLRAFRESLIFAVTKNSLKKLRDNKRHQSPSTAAIVLHDFEVGSSFFSAKCTKNRHAIPGGVGAHF